MDNKKALKQNTVFALVVLVLAVLLFAARAWRNAQNQAAGHALQAELIYGDTGQTLALPLDTAATYDVDTGYYTVHIEVKDGAARFANSPCPDHICENYGWISLEDQTATCLPARAVLAIAPQK
jgi:hypothetical protein